MTDAIVVGAGPNGLSAAIVLAQAGLRVTIYEAQATIGGGCRSAELTRPGFVHDICSAVHPMALASPFLRALPLGQHGVDWIEPGAMVAHPLDGEQPGIIDRSLRLTARGLGDDQRAYERLLGSIVNNWPQLEDAVLGP